MSEVSDTAPHSCFPSALPRLPIGYQFDPNQPMQLVPFTHFSKVLEPIAICRLCYVDALSRYDISYINQLSAELTAKSPISAALSGFSQFAALINSVSHPMFDDIHPPAIREQRKLVSIIGHEARRGNATRKPRLTYVIIYQIGNDPRLSPPVRLTESKMRQYTDAIVKLNNYWYGDKPHNVNTPFVRSVLHRLTPFTNSALWNKLPYDEAIVLHYLWHHRKLHQWKVGMTWAQYKAQWDFA
ncbi:hypothetical protein QFC19_007719 [Naganishia cerealis]|uniref:Uncharacterized protein n=1 Tax=Naganishia cerealis TaxID=610337 RepID=A0ACC2V7S7_9TREE|nr:hypothetical protein QFC19_007719 [Naganishia cerealis]